LKILNFSGRGYRQIQPQWGWRHPIHLAFWSTRTFNQ